MFILKAERDVDFYVVWSTVVEAPVAWGSQAELLPYLYEAEDRKPDRISAGFRPEDRVARADGTGTSALDPRLGAWDDDGLVYQQQGVLPRGKLCELCHRLEKQEAPDVSDLLEPFE